MRCLLTYLSQYLFFRGTENQATIHENFYLDLSSCDNLKIIKYFVPLTDWLFPKLMKRVRSWIGQGDADQNVQRLLKVKAVPELTMM